MDKPARSLRRWLLPPLVVLGLIVVVLAVAGAAAAWMLKTEGGSRWLLSHTPYVHVEGLKGALMGERVEADRVRVEWHGGKASVTIDNVVGDGVHWTWRPAPSSWLGIGFKRLTASTISIVTGPPGTEPGSVPATLTLPLQLNTGSAAADSLVIDGREIVRRMSTGKVALSTNGEHRADDAEADWNRLRIRGSARIASLPPYAMAGTFEAQEADGSDAYTLALKGGGKLESIVLDLTVRSKPQPGREAPSADVHAVIQPWAAWWLAELNARTAALDLAALHSAAPQTRLSGSAKIETTAADAPVSVAIRLDNALPGRWNEGRLPLHRLLLGVQGSTAERSRLVLKDFDVTLGGSQDGGRWRGRGEWSKHDLQLETMLDAVKPQFLDGRAAAMSLTGPLTAKVSGIPSPDGTAPSAPWSATLGAKLEGRLDAAPLPVQLLLDLQTDARRIDVKQLRAQSGSAVAQLQGTATRGGAGDWQLATVGSLAEFDPVPWWPGEAGSPWRQGPHRLNATWKLDLKLPASRPTLLALLQRTAGSGQLSVQESTVAGVPLALDLNLGQTPGGGVPPSHVRAALQLGGNRFELDARGDPAGSGSSDQAQLDVDAPTLATLAPLLRLAPPLAAWLPKSGRLQGRANAAGRWPELRTDGKLDLAALEAGDLAITQASATWRLALDPDTQQPLEAQLDASGVRWGRQKAEKLTAQLRGTPADHQLQVAGAVPLGPPPLAEQMLGLKPGAGTRAQLAAQGHWQRDGAGGGRWQGRIARLAVGTWDGQAMNGDLAAGWIDARDLAAELQFDAEGRLVRVQAPAGRLRVTDATLRWDAVDVDLRGAAPNLALKAQLEPFAVAPLLARAQPTFGWKGDLRLGATLEIRAAERFDADIVFERRDGDLQITDEAGVQTLGLTDLRFALAAHDGTWFFTQAFAGRTLGEMAGALSVKTTPAERWPSKDAPVDGVLQAHVANLGVWGVWVPPGWRLAGELRTSATIGGRFGALQYTGRVLGERIGARNILLGVNLSQGEVAISLNGDSARIDRFTLKGGDGTLTLTGGAEFTDKPVARLHGVAEKFRLLGRIDRQLSTSGSADLTVSFDEVRLDGRFNVDDGLFDANRGDGPTLDDDVTVRRAGDPERSADAANAAARPRRNVAVTVDVDLGRNLRIKGRGLDAELRGQLRITTPNGRLTVVGTVNTEDGTYKAYGQNLTIERGIVAFSGSVENPRLDILALRPNTDTRVGVLISGNLLTPRVRLYSDTDMSDTDRLSWLVLGRAPDGLGRTDTMLLQRAAVALLAGEGDAPTDQLMRTFGLDELSLKQSDTDVRETVISIGRQLSRRWYVGYERGVNATSGTFQLIYRIAQRFTLRAQSGQENSLDVIWSWRFDELPKPPALKASAPP